MTFAKEANHRLKYRIAVRNPDFQCSIVVITTTGRGTGNGPASGDAIFNAGPWLDSAARGRQERKLTLPQGLLQRDPLAG